MFVMRDAEEQERKDPQTRRGNGQMTGFGTATTGVGRPAAAGNLYLADVPLRSV
jgi:hypothetical protein